MTNSMPIETMISKLDDLASARLAWENGTLKASNSELHALLNRCVLLYLELAPSTSLKIKLTQALKQRGITCNKSANLATRIVRWVFGENAQEFVYAKVIKTAADEKSENQSMSDWLLANGGLNLIASRDKNGSDKKQRRTEQIEAGRSYLDTAPSLASVPKDISSLQASSDVFSKFAIALVRRSENGQFDLVFGCNNETLVDQMLQIAGKDAQQRSKAIASSEQAKSKRQAVSEAVQAINAELAV